MQKYTYKSDPLNAPEQESGPENTDTAHSKYVDEAASTFGHRAGIKDSGDLASHEQEKAKLIAEGVQAWKKLYSNQKVPDPTGAAAAFATESGVAPASSSGASNPSSVAEDSAHEQQKRSDTSHSTGSKQDGGEGGGHKCAFASTFGSMPTAHRLTPQPDLGTQPPNPLPTPPDVRMDPLQSPKASKRKSGDFASPAATRRKSADFSSPPPSATGSASKCPIRFLDHYSPEEVAEYFENHKHEIPRSHEVCVKRYQSNAESIRQLDAKYGSLVNMIQGLGAKHQPLLPTKEDSMEEPALEGKSVSKMKKWVEGVDEALSGGALEPETAANAQLAPDTNGYDATHEANSREGRFERPLKDVRVGESPSRPWGISVPFDDGGFLNTTSAPERRVSQASLLQQLPRSTAAGVGVEKPMPQRKEEEQPKMLFTGPVFIGYGPEQAAALLKATGLAARTPEG